MKYIDFHTHVIDEKLYDELKIYALINCMTVEEVKKWLPISKNSPYIKLSIGVHPNAPELLESLLPYYKEGHVIGEIGLDNCWTDMDLDLQRYSFIESLKMAEALDKPIILHTKGMGEEIFRTLQNYKMKKIIHWYSDDISLVKQYPLENAFYTIGPDVENNKNVQDLVEFLEPSQILVETDGLAALEWAFNKNLAPSDIKVSLDNSLNYISEAKNISKEKLMLEMEIFFETL